MSKYRVTNVTFTVTDTPDHGKEFKYTTTGVNVNDEDDVIIFTEELVALTALSLASLYLKYEWDDSLCYFRGERVEVELPNGEKTTVFCRYFLNKNNEKVYCRRQQPTELMHKLWIQMQQGASQTPTNTNRTANQ